MILGLVILVLALVLLIDSFMIVSQKTAVIIERLGKFQSIKTAGLQFKLPIIDRPVKTQDLKIQQMDIDVETKTKDNVFVRTKVSVQFYIMPDKVKESFYELTNPTKQIQAYVYDVIRSEIPKMPLDSVFENKDQVAKSIESNLKQSMDDFGYSITAALLTDIDPDDMVKSSMNRINATEREKIAVTNEAEAEKIRLVKTAEAEAEAKKLTGEGHANLRKEIAKGMKESMDTLKEAGLAPQEAISMLLSTQYMETLNHMSKAGSHTILLPGGAAGHGEIMNQMMTGLLAAKKDKE